jgi:hypothetical protein
LFLMKESPNVLERVVGFEKLMLIIL